MSDTSNDEALDGSRKDQKRKRSSTTNDEEIEIDLKLPEPPSKKAKRQQKKHEKKTRAPLAKIPNTSEESSTVLIPPTEEQNDTFAKRSQYSIWIGNLMWTTTKDDLRQFFGGKGDIEKDHITRVHMPAPPAKGPGWKGPKPVNKGFAYVDFQEEEEMQKAIGLSEELLGGRKVLIKDAKNFEGRPQVKSEEAAATKSSTLKAPSKRVFVGGLSFEITKDDLHEHFSQAGEVEDTFVATFEDTGKCKGFGFVRFTTVEAAQAAVDGYVYKDPVDQDKDNEDDGDEKAESREGQAVNAGESKRSMKKRKWYINRLHGQSLRCEFAEDAQSRYKKRFGKETKSQQSDGKSSDDTPIKDVSDISSRSNRGMDVDQRQAQRRKRHEDARLIAPGRALANAKRATGAIVSSTGIKTTFD